MLAEVRDRLVSAASAKEAIALAEADARDNGVGFMKITTAGIQHIPHDQVMDQEPMPQDTGNDERPSVSLFDDDIAHDIVTTMPAADEVTEARDDPTAALTSTGKTDRKKYLREYMRERRRKEKEAATGATPA